MIEIKNVSKKFADQFVLKDIDLNIADGEQVLFVGQNGAGKSSLMRTILGEYIPTSGSVAIDGFDSFKQRSRALRGISFVPQTPPPLKLSLNELIYFAERTADASRADIVKFCGEMELDLSSNLNKPFHKLSGGMKQKFLIALAFGRASKAMIFDEPTANLDPSARERFKTLLHNCAKDKSLIFISHRLEEVGGLVKRMISMDLGRIVDDKNV
ncbi:ABC transporter ATP-binding protein [uncultured Campylobacter sp.]|uniref:ATP-binding cassette domain-containing protein n=1 Tax=uncultured Campylobacter sp. TaxID=218934 RepID=UPI00263200BD|nr:ABC transporter ATP-binding protein [uncultured Campylobacter sp.]